ncbi:MAG: thioesterase family protein [Rhodobacteraceae bacterium]|uniref:thioesterase family protein n=1 Tax=Albidovulum sp. TaxID=1872424 RepID=UPI001E1453BA|nr:thioesterase family protein [Paracoccaceae bacterium]MCC0045520.1 thioesterase family protein [Defluviimonas sp.]HPE25423.1 thioesterase family protein [Albidovulum sp.]MCB2118510.1 thioesterase family protein [Paracoccaceae bacterium]MCB2123678.1 thioesterase family protein [Paracoccaceae bacterium]
MYPFVRMLKEGILSRRAAPLGITQTHVSHHVCWPWDLDVWAELNNGRTLTLYDLGRIPMGVRTGLIGILPKNRWGITVAGNSLRYRRRVRAFDRIEMRSRVLGWDQRFFYMEQSMWRKGDCTSHMLLRSAVTSADGIVPPARVLTAMGQAIESPELPAWVKAWIDADALRPWPPER